MKIRADHLLLAFMAYLPLCGSAQSWIQTSAPNTNWSCVAASADGAKLVAATSISISNANSIWVSTNAGANWMRTGAPTLNNWYRVASAADGTRLAAASFDGLYISADSGNTWTKTHSASWPWLCFVMSADGLKVVACPGITGAEMLTSRDGGMTWVSNPIPTSTGMFVACPANGSKLVAAVNYPGQILTSTNMGGDWESANFPFPSAALYSIASSAEGSTWVAGGGLMGGSGIFVTTNSGATWISNSVPAFGGGVNWISCAASADGSTLVAVARAGNIDLKFAGVIFTSTNYGASWAQADAPVKQWTCVAVSADGRELLGSAPPDPFTPYPSAWKGGIYISRTTPAPQMNIAPTNNNLLLSWVVPSGNFVLQQNPDLTTTKWIDVTNSPVLDLTNLRNEVFVPVASGTAFYRLKSQ